MPPYVIVQSVSVGLTLVDLLVVNLHPMLLQENELKSGGDVARFVRFNHTSESYQIAVNFWSRLELNI